VIGAFDSIPMGVLGRTQGRTLSDGEASMLHSLGWLTTSIHTDAVFVAEKTRYRAIPIAGPVLLLVATGLVSVAHYYQQFKSSNGLRSVAMLDQHATYRSPFHGGDTMWVSTELVSLRASASNANRGVATLLHSAVNQNDDLILNIRQTMLLEKI
jgi:acyl dehydratase